MVKKTNILREYKEAGMPVPDPMPVIPYVEGQVVTFQQMGQLLSDESRPFTWDVASNEIIYVISGRGLLKVDISSIPIETGDQVILDEPTTYLVQNTGTEPLLFSRIGVTLNNKR